MNLQQQVHEAFATEFGQDPMMLVRAPGRVNLIGEHTDYNDGFVLPLAIDRAVWIALRPRNDRRVVVHSLQEATPIEFDLDAITYQGGWGEYVKGMAHMLQAAGHELRGWEGVICSDVPVGAGLSSSAALEMATGAAFAAVSDFPFDGREMAKLGQATENEWVGAQTGIMDQMVSANGQADCALLIDCRDLTTRAIPLPDETAVLIMDTMTRHQHTESGYNNRRKACERVARVMNVSHLRDADLLQLQNHADEMDPVDFRRARHVITENDRVLAAVAAMDAGDAADLGALMNAGHASLRDDFEVTNEALDTMVRIAQAQPGCYGARMTGGGFGGCAVALVEVEQAEAVAAAVARQYEAATGLTPDVFVTGATDGAAVVENEA